MNILVLMSVNKRLLLFCCIAPMMVCLAAMPELLNAYGLPVASLFVLRSNNMFPDLHQNDMVIVDNNVPFGSLSIGDIVVFKTFGTTDVGQHEIVE
jgi:hypothetical protein